MATALTQINGYAHVAERYGFEEAVFLHSLMFWYRTNRGNDRNFHDGRWWTYNSVKAFEEVFPWWNGGQIRRIIIRCREKGALLDGNYMCHIPPGPNGLVQSKRRIAGALR